MPNLILASIYDVKAAAYSGPIAFPTIGIAQRFLADECANPDSAISRHPEDYDLRKIGEFDSSTGIILTDNAPTVISKALDHFNKK